MEILSEKEIAPIDMLPGDKLILTHTDENGKDHKVMSHDITESMTVNKVAILKVENELGFKVGLAGIFGEA